MLSSRNHWRVMHASIWTPGQRGPGPCGQRASRPTGTASHPVRAVRRPRYLWEPRSPSSRSRRALAPRSGGEASPAARGTRCRCPTRRCERRSCPALPCPARDAVWPWQQLDTAWAPGVARTAPWPGPARRPPARPSRWDHPAWTSSRRCATPAPPGRWPCPAPEPSRSAAQMTWPTSPARDTDWPPPPGVRGTPAPAPRPC